MSDFFTCELPGGVLASEQAVACTPPSDATPLDIIATVSAAIPGWHVFSDGRELHLHLPVGDGLPAEPGWGGLAWEVATSLTALPNGAPLRASVAAAAGSSLDSVAVVTPLGGGASALAHALSATPAPALEPGADAIWDRLAHAARRAQAMRSERRLTAAALAFRGRGRLIGPLRGDLLIRFGVSAWR